MSGGSARGRRGALFLVPVAPRGQGPVAAWISTAQWASAAASRWGDAWVIGPDGPVDLDRVAAVGSRADLRPPPPSSARWRRRVPTGVKTAVQDVRRLLAGRRFAPDVEAGPWAGRDLLCVWQRHEPWVGAGRRVADRLGCPLVQFVPAPVVWEAEVWGVRRPGWGRLVARYGEAPPLRAADVVACGSTAVAEVVADLGVPADRIVLTPNGVDVDRFAPSPDRDATRDRLGLADRFVVVWSGSFRGFHGVHLLVDAVARLRRRVPEVTLLFVGDGPQRPAVQARCEEQQVPAAFTGTVPHGEVPVLLGAADVAVVPCPAGAAYHYSPLKLWEYLACGLATVAPAVGQPAEVLTDGVDSLLVPPGSEDAVAEAVARLHDEPGLRAKLGAAARELAVTSLSWTGRLAPVEEALAAARR